ncbi:capsular biosynthesis protein [Clostridiaceae bacterium 14S0207]|nr:capsular biosynthesis protein [Clostridiaceae bacterium 14S0207]
MDIQKKFNEKLSKLLFLELKKGHNLGEYEIKENIYVPIKAESIVDRVNHGEKAKEIPISFFIEGIIFVLGADPLFKYKKEYLNILNNINNSIDFIKNKIFNEIKEHRYEDAYIFLKGLLNLESTEEVFDKCFLLLENLRKLDKEYLDEELEIIEKAKKLPNFAEPYLYDSIVSRDKEEFSKALVSIHTYLELGGKETKEISEFKENLININQYNKGKELAFSEPENALKHLLPLIDYFGDSANIYYYIALCYRVLGNFEKAIYYLNEASVFDEALLEVMNEYGINYASLGDFKKATLYFEKAFETSKSIEICTNIVMCYLNLNDLENAKKFMEEAIKIDKDDEIVNELKVYFKDL